MNQNQTESKPPSVEESTDEGLDETPCSPDVKPMGAVTICRNGYLQEVESERDRYKLWAHKFRDLLAPLAWLDGVDNPNDTEKAIIQFDEENSELSGPESGNNSPTETKA